MQMILASGSPRRKELLEHIGLEFEICPAKGEEQVTSTVPSELVLQLSGQKAKEVASSLLAYQEKHRELCTPMDLLVIGADTVVSYEGRILGKPKDEEDAMQMLLELQGNTHSVFTGVTTIFAEPDGRTGEYSFYERTDVTFYPMSDEEIRRYIATGDPLDKAGAYGIQGIFSIYVKKIDGDYNNVVGFPVSRFYQEMAALGVQLYAIRK